MSEDAAAWANIYRLMNFWREQEGLPRVGASIKALRMIEGVAIWLAEHGADPWRDCRPRKPDRPGEAA